MKHPLTTGTLSLALAIVLACSPPAAAQALQKITINFPTRSGASWPLFLAKEGGYYQKYGLDVDLVFAGHPGGIAMVNTIPNIGAFLGPALIGYLKERTGTHQASFLLLGGAVIISALILLSLRSVSGVAEAAR
jgi:hypothetical protein